MIDTLVTIQAQGLQPVAPPGADRGMIVIGWSLYIGSMLLILALIVSAVYLGWEKATEGSSQRATRILIGALLGCILIVSVTAVFTALTGWSLFS